MHDAINPANGPEQYSQHEVEKALFELADYDGNIDEAIKNLRMFEDNEAAEVLERLEVGSGGKLYTVEIPDESLMLDWDKPLSEQPENVRAKAAELLAESTGMQPDHPNFPDMVATLEPQLGSITGEDLYNRFKNVDPDPARISARLSERGIPGLTYVGRSSDERNFVVFDDEMVNLIEKGQVDPKLLPGLAAAGAAGSFAVSRRQPDYTEAAKHLGRNLLIGMADMFTALDPSVPIGAEEGADTAVGHSAAMDRWSQLLGGDQPLTPEGKLAITSIIDDVTSHGAFQEVMNAPGVSQILDMVYGASEAAQEFTEEVREESPRAAAALDVINPI